MAESLVDPRLRNLGELKLSDGKEYRKVLERQAAAGDRKAQKILEELTSNKSGSGSGSGSGSRLASTVFRTGTMEDLATVDVYREQTRDVINSIQDILSLLDKSSLNSLRGGDFLRNISPIISSADKAFIAINESALMDRIVSASGINLGSLREIGGDFSKKLSGVLSAKDTVLAEIGGVVSKISSLAINNVKALGNVIGEIAGDAGTFLLKDTGGLVSLYTSVIDEARELGITNAFHLVTSTIDDPYIVNRVAGNLLQGFVETSDEKSLLGAALGVSKGVIDAVNPRIIDDFTRVYQNKITDKLGDIRYKYGDVMHAFDAIDSSWDRYQRAGEDVAINITKIQNSSPSFRELIRSGVDSGIETPRDDQEFYTLAEAFKPIAVYDTMRNDFPSAAIQGDVDPRLKALGEIEWSGNYRKLVERQAAGGDQNARNILNILNGN